MEEENGGQVHSDALVCLGMTGDLARKMIFPAPYATVRRGVFRVPVVGVASWH
jgi:glucose-6-phosphate 1-dehydrogenase